MFNKKYNGRRKFKKLAPLSAVQNIETGAEPLGAEQLVICDFFKLGWTVYPNILRRTTKGITDLWITSKSIVSRIKNYKGSIKCLFPGAQKINTRQAIKEDTFRQETVSDGPF